MFLLPRLGKLNVFVELGIISEIFSILVLKDALITET